MALRQIKPQRLVLGAGKPALCLEIELHALDPPAGRGSAGEKALRQERFYALLDGRIIYSLGLAAQNSHHGITHGKVFLAVYLLDFARVIDILDRDFVQGLDHLLFQSSVEHLYTPQTPQQKMDITMQDPLASQFDISEAKVERIVADALARTPMTANSISSTRIGNR
jgi:hypothetical protein